MTPIIRFVRHEQSGNTSAEMLIVIQVLLAIVGGTIDCSLAFFTGHMLQNAAHQGARIAVTMPGLEADPNAAVRMETAVKSRLANNKLLEGANITVAGPVVFGDEPTSHKMVRVTVEKDYSYFFFRLVGVQSVHLTRESTMRYEWQIN